MRINLKFMASLMLLCFTTLTMMSQAYRTTEKPSGTLPLLYVNVYNEDGSYNDEIIDINLSHKEYFTAEYWLDINGCDWAEEAGYESVGSAEEPLPAQIKARGNYTRTHFCKKPFKLKLEKKQNLMGLTEAKSKHYALLAQADDSHGFLRNYTGFELGRRIGLAWSPKQQPVELIVNGDYRGLYFLTESIRVQEGRIEIEELADLETDPAKISGGYLVELDNHPEENCIKFQEQSCVWGDKTEEMAVTWDTPEDYSDLQIKFVTEQFTKMNEYIGSKSNTLWRYMDMDDAARYYIVMELTSHREAYRGSTYLFRERGEGQKWRFAPVWDFGHGFDAGTTNFFYQDYMFHNVWIASICQNSKFQEKVKETWKWFMSNNFDGIYEDMDDFAINIKEAAVSDWKRWKSVPKPNYTDSRSLQNNSDMNSKNVAAQMQMQQKVEWLTKQWGSFDVSNPTSEPTRDGTSASPLPDYAKGDSGIEDVIFGGDITTADTEAEYYNLQGMRVMKPESGVLYIVVRGEKATKEIYK